MISLSTTARGKAFEVWTEGWLRRKLGMDLVHTGGAGDKGIDLLGWWRLPKSPQRQRPPLETANFRVIVQCKAESKKLGPRHLRELEGSMHRIAQSSSAETSPPLGVFASSSPFTSKTVQQALTSPMRLLLIQLAQPRQEDPRAKLKGEEDTDCLAFFANETLQKDLDGVLEVSTARTTSSDNVPRLQWIGCGQNRE